MIPLPTKPIPPPATIGDLHFLALCLVLLCEHPVSGASLRAVIRGERSPYRVGWNRIQSDSAGSRSRWVHISPKGGLTTMTPPTDVPEDEIHIVDSTTSPPLWETASWPELQLLVSRHSDQAWARETVERITAASQLSVPHDEAAITAHFNGLNQLLSTWSDLMGGVGGKASLEAATSAVVRPFLDLEVPGCIAGPLLVLVLWDVGDGNARDALDERVRRRRALAERVAELVEDRRRFRVGTSALFSYLAALYSSAALLLSEHLASQPTISDGQRSYLELSDQNVDEMLCHDVLPHLVAMSITTFERSQRYSDEELAAFDSSLGVDDLSGDVAGHLIGKYSPLT